MKKKILSIIALTLVAGFLGFEANRYNKERFQITSPMMDEDFKIQIIKDSGNWLYKLENLRPLMGAEELAQFIQENDNKPETYTPPADGENKPEYQANLHMHTLNSDGSLSVQEVLDMAQEYAEKNLPEDELYYLAITDHNTVWGAQEVVRVLQKNPGKYNRIRVAPGIEIYATFINTQLTVEPVDIHVLAWSINPFNAYLNKEFYKKDPKDKWNRRFDRHFDELIKTMRSHSIVGIAHPASYTLFLKEKKYQHITDLFERYKKAAEAADNKERPLFAEAYYQTYAISPSKEANEADFNEFLEHITAEATRLGIMKTGSTDMHGKSLLTR